MKFLAAASLAVVAATCCSQADAAAAAANAAAAGGANTASALTTVMAFGQALAPLISASKKECHQLACWVAVANKDCVMTAANQVQRELTRGRNAFAVDSTEASGSWVRYWRTQFLPPDRGDVADGVCTDGSKFVVTNCQVKQDDVHC